MKTGMVPEIQGKKYPEYSFETVEEANKNYEALKTRFSKIQEEEKLVKKLIKWFENFLGKRKNEKSSEGRQVNNAVNPGGANG